MRPILKTNDEFANGDCCDSREFFSQNTILVKFQLELCRGDVANRAMLQFLIKPRNTLDAISNTVPAAATPRISQVKDGK